MTTGLVLSLDAMGGDHAPQSVVDGAALFLKARRRKVRLLFHGDERVLAPLIARHDALGRQRDSPH